VKNLATCWNVLTELEKIFGADQMSEVVLLP
jgi:hypothetical protein